MTEENGASTASGDGRVLRRSIRPLPVKLTADDIMKASMGLANVCDEIATEEGRQDSIKKSLKARVAELEARRTQLANLIRRGDEIRDVAVTTFADYEEGVARDVRMDNGEILATRPLTEKERQPDLLTPETQAAAQAAAVVHSEEGQGDQA